MANKRHLWSRDDEGGFYIVYNQLLCHWFSQGYSYHVFFDRKKNSNRRRVDELRHKTMRYTTLECAIACMEEVESDECVLVQLADLLIGCVGYKWNGRDDKDCYPMAILTATLTANLQTRCNGCGQFACGAGRKPPANTRALRPERLLPYTRRSFPAMVLSCQTLSSITDRKEPWTNITAN